MKSDAYILKDLRNQKVFVVDEGETTIGRGTQSKICLPDSMLSREHAAIRRADKQLWVKDLDSTNGTRLNQGTVGKEIELKHGDILKLGDHELQMLFPDGGEVAPQEPSQGDDESYVAMNSLGAKTTLKQAFSLPPGWSQADKGQFGKKADKPATKPSPQKK